MSLCLCSLRYIDNYKLPYSKRHPVVAEVNCKIDVKMVCCPLLVLNIKGNRGEKEEEVKEGREKDAGTGRKERRRETTRKKGKVKRRNMW